MIVGLASMRFNAGGRITPSIAALFSFEVFFVLFLFSGQYKAHPWFAWWPVDITALFFGLSILAGGGVLLRRRFHLHQQGLGIILAALGFVLWMVVSLAWSPGKAYATEKALHVATLNLWPLFATALIIAPDPRRFHRFVLALVVFVIGMSLGAMFFYFQASEVWFVTVMGGNYLGLGRTVGLGALIVLAFWLFGDKGRFTKSLWFGLFFLFLFVLAIAGGRGPVVATLAGLLVPLVAGWRLSRAGGVALKRYQIALLGILSLAVTGTVYLVATGAPGTTILRFITLLTELGGGESANLRFQWYTGSVSLWLEAPIFGHGIGSWPMLIGMGDVRDYPHNIFLEVMVELGLVGLLLLVGLFAVGVRTLSGRGFRHDAGRLLVLMLLLFTVVNAQVSGDIPDNRVMFGMLGLMALSARSERS